MTLSDSGLIAHPDQSSRSIKFKSVRDPGDINLRALVRSIKLPGKDEYFVFMVTGPESDIQDDVNSSSNQLTIALLIVAICFLIKMLYQIRLVLSPLMRAKQEVADVRTGSARQLSNVYPKVISPLAKEINELLNDNQSIVERSRPQASNLAHALKNPLTVIRNECQDSGREKIRDQVDKLDLNINRYLSWVRVANPGQHASVTKVGSAIEDIVYTLKQIHKDRPLDFTICCNGNLQFREIGRTWRKYSGISWITRVNGRGMKYASRSRVMVETWNFKFVMMARESRKTC